MTTPSQFAPLLERVRSKRKLPIPAQRRRIREEAGISLRAMAAALKVSHTAVASWERGATPREHVAAYAQLLTELEDALRGEA